MEKTGLMRMNKNAKWEWKTRLWSGRDECCQLRKSGKDHYLPKPSPALGPKALLFLLLSFDMFVWYDG
jgi:hypothetical protein